MRRRHQAWLGLGEWDRLYLN